MPTVQETIGIPPPPGAAAELKLPLSFFDVWWIHVEPTRRLLFYDYPCSTATFLDTVVPKLKESLSLTLKHYLPAAGNLLVFSDADQKPVFRYVAGDSVPLTITESSRDFYGLTGNHPRDADQFYELMPQLPPAKEELGFKLVPLLALQVTLFPGRGLSIGAANHHSLGDARSMFGFISAWAEINKSGGDAEFLTKKPESLPIFDRSAVRDSAGIDSILWNTMKLIPFDPSPPLPLPTKRVRSTFLLSQSDLKKLKSTVSAAKPSVGPATTSFVTATAYAWSCLAKSTDAAGEKIDDGAKEVFVIIANARGRPNAIIDPPVPANYFGNCLGGGAAVVDHKVLASAEGFPAAAEAISKEIKHRVYNKDEFLRGAENWASEMEKYMGMRSLCVTDSPKFDLYEADFGWGKAKKVEVVSIDGGNYVMSLCNSDGGLEVGMSLPKEIMEAFAAIFARGLD